MLEEFSEIAHARFGAFIHADDADLLGQLGLTLAAVNVEDAGFVGQNAHGGADRGYADDLVAECVSDALHLPLRVVKAVGAGAGDRQVAHDAVDSGLHFVGEPGHDAVHDDHRGHAEHDADDRRQHDVARPQVTKTKK